VDPESVALTGLDDGPTAGGETCRTTAHLVTALDDRYYDLERLHGGEGPRLAAESHGAAIDRIERIVRDERIDCDFVWVDGTAACRKSCSGIPLTRITTVQEFVKENVSVAIQYGDLVTPGEVRDASDVAPGQAAIVRRGAGKIAVYRDDNGHLHERSAFCTSRLRGAVEFGRTDVGLPVPWFAIRDRWTRRQRSGDSPPRRKRVAAIRLGPLTTEPREPVQLNGHGRYTPAFAWASRDDGFGRPAADKRKRDQNSNGSFATSWAMLQNSRTVGRCSLNVRQQHNHSVPRSRT
jgi:hypothetical protein